MTRFPARLFSSTLVALTLGIGLAYGQSSLGLGNAEPVAQPSGLIANYAPWFQLVLSWINSEQQAFYRLLTGSLKAMRQDPWELSTLIGLSFAYGVFHAAGPGHGKAVISSYMIANETELKRGIVISFLSAIMQGGVAILLVGAGFLFLRGASVTMTDAARYLETVSFAGITAFGLWLLLKKFQAITQPVGAQLAAPGHHHGLGEVCDTCGHAHAPLPETLAGPTFSLKDAFSAVIVVGLRPCSGALIVLTFSFLNGLILGGVLSVIAMSIGTALTVSALATLAVTAKDWALRFGRDGSNAQRLSHGIEVGGALLVILFGVTLLMASLQA